ncbi:MULTISPECIES: acyltransferase family protein [unclassified Brevibacterium]|uniref:acyltransferase family protein n=1 Tax=unclassified Brevibacterium TaxID=2614124 RepID=UPI0010923968|nr:acyltransferase [Brevibacterium sp. S22]TGD29676.1 acyltransferase [Brevibacterium sp. S22]
MTLMLNDPAPPAGTEVGRTPESAVAPPAEPRTREPRTAAAPHRDQAIDLIRFGCLVVVVILHSMMSAAVLGPDGRVAPTVALSTTAGFAAASWFFQVMPLFFIIGGYAGITGWRRTRARGGIWTDYLRARLRRLAVPTAVLVVIAGIGLSAAADMGVSSELIVEASRRIGQPLWFLAVYLGLSSLVPVAVHFHERAPRRSLAVLAGAVIAVDVLARTTGIAGLGYLNFVVVWPLIQQLGFFFADAVDRPISRPAVWTALAAALGLLGGLVAAGVYSPNMLVNLNPPTGALVLLGVAQLCVLQLFHARLNQALNVDEPSAESTMVPGEAPAEAAPTSRTLTAQLRARVIAWGNTYGMQVYLWHMSVVIVLIGALGWLAQTAVGFPTGILLDLPTGTVAEFILPEIESGWWWATRLPWLLAVMGLSALAAMAAERIPFPSEQRLAAVGRSLSALVRAVLPQGFQVQAFSSRARAIVAVGAATMGIAIALLVGIAPMIWTVVAAGLLMGSLILSAGLTPLRQPAGR